jgi:hypothetical protein
MRVFQVTAPKLSDVLAQEISAKVDQLRQVFHAFASFGSRQVQYARAALCTHRSWQPELCRARSQQE